MMTVNEVSKLTGVSIRALQYYDKIGLLHPAEYTEAGYRLYDDTALARLQSILLFRELEFPLKDIKRSACSKYCCSVSLNSLSKRFSPFFKVRTLIGIGH